VRRAFDVARSSFSVLLVVLFFVFPGTPVMYLAVYPLIWLQPQRKRFHISWFMKMMSWGILTSFRIGGARFERSGRIPTGEGGSLVIMNHQSQLDICTATLMGHPFVPTFVPRALYARGVPLVSASIRLLECPVVDPKRDPKGAVEALREAARRVRYALLIFPEGHRTTGGELRPFRTAGLRAILETRRMPVYLVVTDGFWAGRRFVDFLANVPHVRGRTEVLGPFPPPERDEEIDAAIEGWRGLMIERLARVRQGEAARA
jgi:1-acyl-sn-glycerol-3-phosphate acyltransferase